MSDSVEEIEAAPEAVPSVAGAEDNRNRNENESEDEDRGGGELPSPIVAARGPRQMLVREEIAGGSIVAEWWGVPPAAEPHESPFPIEYGIDSLWFTFAGSTDRVAFVPAGTMNFSDWRTNIFSPDGERVILAQDRFGPYHVILRDELRDYLEGRARPERVIEWRAEDEFGFVPVHGAVQWVGPTSIKVFYESETSEWRYYELSEWGGELDI